MVETWTVLPRDDWYDDLLDDEREEVETEKPEPPKRGRHELHCECGRFGKWGGDRHYYNGRFDCYSFDVICTRCGTVTVECV